MRFHFDANQTYQLRAIEAVADLFRGQSLVAPSFETLAGGELYRRVGNRLDLTEAQILENLRAVQAAGGIPQDSELRVISERFQILDGEREVRFPNFSVEMERADEI